jgi:hypothetical protein
MSEVGFLVELSRVESESIDDIVHLLGLTIFELLRGLLSRGVGTGVYCLVLLVRVLCHLSNTVSLHRRIRTNTDIAALVDHFAIDLVDDAIDLLEIPGIGDDLVIGDQILE